ncbi:MAG TPA: SRPBCC domain-containing protein [Streptosporangiaceae bacterium]
MADRIEQSVEIQAPLDRVWELVSEPGWWVPSDVGTPPAGLAPGQQVVRESEKWGRFPVEVVRVEPKTYAAFRWASQAPGAELTPVNTTLVEFRVEAAGDLVRVTVTESGFAALDVPAAAREQARKDNTGGWQEELGSLRERAEAA